MAKLEISKFFSIFKPSFSFCRKFTDLAAMIEIFQNSSIFKLSFFVFFRIFSYFCSDHQNLPKFKHIQAFIFHFVENQLIFAAIIKMFYFSSIFQQSFSFCRKFTDLAAMIEIFQISSIFKLYFFILSKIYWFLQRWSKSSNIQANSSCHFSFFSKFQLFLQWSSKSSNIQAYSSCHFPFFSKFQLFLQR